MARDEMGTPPIKINTALPLAGRHCEILEASAERRVGGWRKRGAMHVGSVDETMSVERR